jgi:hypothetical protein
MWRAAIGTAVACLFLAACDDKPLFQAPPRGGDAAPVPPVSDSVITLVAKLPYTALKQAADAKIPASVQRLVAASGPIAAD